MPVDDLIDVGHTQPGLPPGTLVYTGDRRSDAGRITISTYNKDYCEEWAAKDVKEIKKALKKPGIKWINVDNLHNLKLIQEIGNEFDLHPMLLEDLVNTEQRPKIDDYQDHMFIIIKSIDYNARKEEMSDEQIGIVLGKDFVISFHEKKPDNFRAIRENIKHNRGRIRKAGSDYLAYALIDAIVDGYFVVLERVGERIADVDEELSEKATKETLDSIQQLKREILYLRRAIWPMREFASKLSRKRSGLFKKSTEIYLKDLADHILQISDTVETFNTMLTNMLDVYMSNISNKTNEILKVLTIFSTVFIPLTFITGLYGMNFENMPELQHPFGYFAVLFGMALISIGWIIYIKKKEWI